MPADPLTGVRPLARPAPIRRSAGWTRAGVVALSLLACACGPTPTPAPSPADQEATAMPTDELLPDLGRYVSERLQEFDRIEAARKAELDEFATWLRTRAEAKDPVKLVFICTHNSRRSHMMQLWAQVAARVTGMPGVETYSGGTEATAFNPRAVAAVKRAGMTVEVDSSGPDLGAFSAENPRYRVRIDEDAPPLVAFSKVYDSAPNPKSGFAAVMACSQADGACPVVQGSIARFALPYVDPKVSDGTPEEAATYDERCAQIAREMLYAFMRAR